MAISFKNIGTNLISEKTSAVLSAAATATATYLGKTVEVLAPVANLTLLEAASFGFVVNRVARLANAHIFNGSQAPLKQLASYAIGGLSATGLSHAAVHLGLSAAAVTPAGAVALTIVAALASRFAPSDRRVADFASKVVHAPVDGFNWAKAKAGY